MHGDRSSTSRPLLERDVETARIDGMLAALEDGDGRIAAVEGPPGIGKTRLLEEARDRAASRGFSVLSARGGELERDYAFGIVRQLLEPRLAAAEPAERASLMAGAARFAEPIFADRPAEADRPGDPSHALLHGLYWLAVNLAERDPLVVTVDDAHWADGPSLRFLRYLARRLEGVRLLLVVALRPREPGAESAGLTGLAHEPGAVLLEPQPLSAAAVRTLVEAELGAPADPELCAACHDATKGNAWLLAELLADLRRERDETARAITPAAVKQLGPQRISTAVLLRVARLPAPAPDLAQAVAVLGEMAELRHAAALASVELPSAGEVADTLVDAGVLERGRPLRFAHPIVRTAIYRDMADARRRTAHARAARMLADDRAPPDVLAAHLLATEPAGERWTVGALRQAARSAAGRGAPEAAVLYLRRALAEPPEPTDRATLVAELAHAEYVARDPVAGQRLSEALELTDDVEARVRLALQLFDVLMFANRFPECYEVVTRISREVEGQRPDLQLRLDTARANMLLLGEVPGRDEIVRELPRLRAMADASGPAGRGALINLALRASGRGEPAGEVVELVERGLDGGRLIAEESADAVAAVQAVCALAFIDELGRAGELLDDMFEDAQARGSVLGYVAASVWRGYVALRRGRLSAVERDAHAALELTGQHGLAFAEPYPAAFLCSALIERGELAEAERVVDAVPLEPLGPTPGYGMLVEARGRLRLAQGRRMEGIEDVGRAGAMFEAIENPNPNFVPWRSTLALGLAPEGREEALDLIEAELALARAAGLPRAIGVATRASALLSTGAERLARLEEAIGLLGRSPARLELARTLVAQGAALRQANRRVDAREPLKHGLELAHQCAATALAVAARDELLASGARPRRPRLTGRDALTASESRVARMAADGLSNKEIAQELFVTVKTVEMHLGNTYRKLGIRSRSELPAVLGENGS